MEGVRARFEQKVDRNAEHHLWTGSRSVRGVGRLRVDGKLVSAPAIAWTLAFGEPAVGDHVLACPENPSCVHPRHLRLVPAPKAPVRTRGQHGTGSMAALSEQRWKISISAGNDDGGRRRRVSRTVHGTRADAARELARFTVEIGDGSGLPGRDTRDRTVDELVTWYVGFARNDRGLEHSTLTGYTDVYRRWIQPHIGQKRAVSIKPGDLDSLFGRMRRAGLSHSRMNNARALLSGAYKWGKRHGMAPSNPVERFELPNSTHRPRTTNTPELDDLLQLLDGADQFDTELAPILKLGATTGMRRGELAGLRRNRLRLANGELVVDNAVNDAGGLVVEKPTKTQRSRVVSIDAATVSMLTAHLATMDERARFCGARIPPDAFVFSLEVTCQVPMRPEFMTRRMRILRQKLDIGPGDFDATILALRKWTSTELMDAGFNPSAVSDRQGHTVQVMLHHYSSRRRSADRAAAEHLGAQVHRSADATTHTLRPSPDPPPR